MDVLPQTLIDLSRLQFASTAMYHFLFVPLTLGLSFMLFVMECVYVMTGREIWKEMTQFWGKLFGINFALGVATGITMEFQFGTNWSYYSHFVGDVFGAPLAIEGLMAFFLEATFVGLFFFGWDRLSRIKHLMVTFLVAIGTNFSALWILIANGWMQSPVGAELNVDSLRMEITSFYSLFLNPVAQAKFVHTVAAGYVTAAVFVLSVSAWYCLKGRHLALAERSMAVAVSFGLASALSVVVLGDESGYLTSEHQQMKMASIEAMWETKAPPASFTLFGFPDTDEETTHFAVEIPYVMGLIGTRSVDTPIPGIRELVASGEGHIREGALAYKALTDVRENPNDDIAKAVLKRHQSYLGYGMLLLPLTEHPEQATEAQIHKAAQSLIPEVAPLFWSFRFMVGLGLYFIALFAIGFYLSSIRRLNTRWYLKMALCSLPLPWVAAELGWFVAEYGRQPWLIEGILPTFVGVSSLTTSQLLFTLIGFASVYTLLAVIEIRLMIKAIVAGPHTMKG